MIPKPADVLVQVAGRNDKITKKCLAHLKGTQKYPYDILLLEEKGPYFPMANR
ncbi:MAG: hypothetical protein QHH00_04340 [Methanomassiliicoccales archaeon]|jgi:hypothetical protein|nr:hypothetical protein [Methanomassiliicoccales archaeon]